MEGLNVMIDLETLGTSPNSMVLTVGAVAFIIDYPNPAQHPFYEKIDINSYDKTVFSFDADTLAWWMNQSEEARKEAFTGKRKGVEEVLDALSQWFEKVTNGDAKVKVWSQGAAFDVVILETLFKHYHRKAPWSFWNVRDTRTLYDIAGVDFKKVFYESRYPPHHALGDCLKQIQAVQISIGKLRKK